MCFSAFTHCALTVARIPFYLRLMFCIWIWSDPSYLDRKVIEHRCSIVSLKIPRCAFRIVQRRTSRSCQIRTHKTRWKKCVTPWVNRLHIMLMIMILRKCFAQTSGEQSDSVASNALSTGHESNLIQPRNDLTFMSIADFFLFLFYRLERCLYGNHKTRQGIRQSAYTDRLATCKKNGEDPSSKDRAPLNRVRAIRTRATRRHEDTIR